MNIEVGDVITRLDRDSEFLLVVNVSSDGKIITVRESAVSREGRTTYDVHFRNVDRHWKGVY